MFTNEKFSYKVIAMSTELIKAIIYLFVGVSIFIVSMRIMSSGLKKISGKGLKRLFKKTQNNPLAGLGIGTVVTTAIQSSDATSCIVLGFINAGAMTIYQGLSIILGAYIGTTITGVLVSFSSFSISIYLLLFAFIGVILTFINNEKCKNIGEILTGLGFIFFSLEIMKSSFQNPDINLACSKIFSSLSNPFLLYLLGIVITALVQSSSAITGIVIIMISGGAIAVDSGIYIIIGATLGTVATTLLASVGGDIKGKRTAWICFALRFITSFLTISILAILTTQNIYLGELLTQLFSSFEFAAAMFLVFYNLLFMPLLIPFLKPCIKLSEKLIRDKKEEGMKSVIHYIDAHLLKSPNIAIMQTKREIVHMFELSKENYIRGYERITKQTTEQDKSILEVEDQIDYLNKAITDFLIKLANNVSDEDSKKVGGYFHVINDIERIGDHACNFLDESKIMVEDELKFSDEAISEVDELNKIIIEMFDLALIIFRHNDTDDLKKLHILEEKTDELSKSLAQNHYHRITQNSCSPELTSFYSELITELERVADHLTNIGYSIVDPIGDELE